jgi:hypothetical protein
MRSSEATAAAMRRGAIYLHEMFEAQVERTPGAVALIYAAKL